MAITTAYVVAPMFTATEVVAFFFASVAGKTSFRYFLRRFVLERDYLFGIAFFGVSLARTVTSLATRDLPFPTAYGRKFSMRGMREGFELIFVAILASFATDVICSGVTCGFDLV